MKTSNRIIRNINFQSFVSDLSFHICLFIFVLLLLTSCDTTEPPSSHKLTLTEEDASCTEAWLNLKLDNISLPTEVSLKQNDSTIITATINSSDTTLYIKNLLPNRTYSFYSTISSFQNSSAIKSNNVSITTMDTTSHDITWETFTIGDGGLLRDVAVINENNIWAVGEIHTAETDQFDSNGVWVQPYNAVHWNGEKWKLIRIGGYGYWAYSTVFAFESDDVWFDGTVQWDGQKYTAHMNNFPLEPNGDGWMVYGMWGTSSKDFYVVGNGGNIAHYNGNSWKKIESGTDVDLVDIWGSSDGKKIWVCGNDDFKPTVLLKIVNKKADVLYSSSDNRFSYNFNQLSGDFTSIWTNKSNSLYILTAYDLYRIYKDNISRPTPLWKNREQIATRKARGTSSNNIFIVGENGSLSHYNGVSWKTYNELSKGFREYKSISVTKNIIVAVGEDKIIVSTTKK
ncbi:hypothetical protein MNBD_IGNAVI01-1727 [hydrothermal vent metagenome]|uniref:Glucosyl transferase n=1 Tax=hydrothermal vent metagenome TaxID=652676 RepID=A0A3B1CIN8_9ZZZZ